MFRICYNFRIVGAWRNFCSQAHRQPARSSEVCIFFTSRAGGQRLSRGRDVGGAVPYKRDRIVFLLCPAMVVIVDLFLRRANAVRPYRFVAVILSDIYIQFSSCVRGATLGIKHTHALTQVLYSLFQNLSSYSLSRRACTCPQVSKRFLLIPEKYPFCCIKNATIAEMLPN